MEPNVLAQEELLAELVAFVNEAMEAQGLSAIQISLAMGKSRGYVRQIRAAVSDGSWSFRSLRSVSDLAQTLGYEAHLVFTPKQ